MFQRVANMKAHQSKIIGDQDSIMDLDYCITADDYLLERLFSSSPLHS